MGDGFWIAFPWLPPETTWLFWMTQKIDTLNLLKSNSENLHFLIVPSIRNP